MQDEEVHSQRSTFKVGESFEVIGEAIPHSVSLGSVKINNASQNVSTEHDNKSFQKKDTATLPTITHGN